MIPNTLRTLMCGHRRGSDPLFQNPTHLLQRLCAIVRALVVATCVGFTVLYLVVAMLRLRYPFELEWMEGGMVEHVRRLLAGQPIYARPSLAFVSYFYPPLYYIVAAAVARVIGVGFLPLRLVSLLSSIAVFVLLFAIVRRETGSARTGLIAAGLFAATYARLGTWFDLARSDTFYLFLLLASAFALRCASTAGGAVAAGLLMGAAYLTKQSAALIAIPLAIGCALVDRKHGLWFIGTAALGMLVSTAVLDRATGGWFTYYCLTLPARHPGVEGTWLLFWRTDMLRPLGIACLASLWFVVKGVRKTDGAQHSFYPCFAAGLLGVSWWIRTKTGADVNDLLPAYAAVSMLAALALYEIRGPRLALAAEVLLLAQFGLLAYDPRKALPSDADRAAGARLVERIAGVPGDVFVPHHGYLAQLAGKRAYAHAIAMDQVFNDDAGPVREALLHEMETALHDTRFGAVLLEVDRRYEDAIVKTYPSCARLFERSDTFIPVAGAPLRPEFLCLPSSARP